jgi:hypothetical protein
VTSRGHQLALAGVSFIVASGIAWLALSRPRAEEPTVVIVDNTQAIGDLLESRRSETEPAALTDYPPPFLHEGLDEEAAALFFPANKNSSEWMFDPQCFTRRIEHRPQYFRRLDEHPGGGWDVSTNDYGMREDEDVLTEPPDVRIVVTGDSHVDGVCSHAEAFPNVLEATLWAERTGQVVEVLNAGVGGSTLHNYVGMFERLRHLAPDVFVVVVYGGNDFSAAVSIERYFARRGAGEARFAAFRKRLKSAAVESLGAQELFQDFYFEHNPGDEAVAIDLVCSMAVELERQCGDAGTALLLVYLPPPSRAQPALYGETARRFLGQAGLKNMRLGVSDRIADAWFAFLAERGLAAVDLRPYFRNVSEPLYWRTDHHLNVAGQQFVAEVLYEPVTELLVRRESDSR